MSPRPKRPTSFKELWVGPSIDWLIFNVTRFIITGDGDYKPYVSADPDVTSIEMNGTEDFIIIACDGLWDTVTPEEATNCVFDQLHADKGTCILSRIMGSKPSRTFVT